MATEVQISNRVLGKRFHLDVPISWIYVLFFFSGIPALIYQVVWQRALFALYGVNVQSVTVVVSAFMMGLGLGSLLGGALCQKQGVPLIAMFVIAETGTGVFGVFSLILFRCVGASTAGGSLLQTGIVGFALVLVPTLLMGSTLPILVEHLARSSRQVGPSVGGLYFANTLGSGVACFLAAGWLMRDLGLSGSVRFAAGLNALIALAALILSNRTSLKRNPELEHFSDTDSARSPLPFSLALVCAGFSGFAALSYEIIWYRMLAFATGDRAASFATLLGGFLFGLALGSRFIQRYSASHSPQKAMPALVAALFGSSIIGFVVSPASSWACQWVSLNRNWPSNLLMLILICLATSFFGATLPLIAHVSIPADRAGLFLSRLYALNIAGSTLGTLVVGFILMDRFSVLQISLVLLAGGCLCALAVSVVSRPQRTQVSTKFVTGAVAVIVTIVATKSIFPSTFDRLLFKDEYPTAHFGEVVQNRSGVIGVTPNGIVFGSGVYDGRFNVDLLHDTNIIIRPYALSAIHPNPQHVLMIGLGSGSWAQVIANHPQLGSLTVVEINPGYSRLLSAHPEVASLVTNPKVRFVIDDGRRWLLANRDAHFDMIVMNTTFHWRNHASNLLSVEFLKLVRPHLKSGGILFYNTTGSDDVIATGMYVYPFALRFTTMLAVSDSPIVLDRERWKSTLLKYVIDGHPIIDSEDAAQLRQLDSIVDIRETSANLDWHSIESLPLLRHRLDTNHLIITDDNMGLEWR